MGIDNVSIAAAASGPAAIGSGRNDSLGKEDFLKLMVTQLTQQDPMNPQDGTQYVAQLAQFTALERMVNMEKTMQHVALAATATNSTLAVGFIGKTVLTNGDTVTIGSQGGADVNFIMPQDANVSVEIRDENGDLVKTIHMDATEGSNSLYWNGYDNDGNRAPVGEYTINVVATDEQGNPIKATTQMKETIKSVSFANGYPELVMESGRKVMMAEVTEVLGPEEKEETDGNQD
jgi:flagellar basal-body rod modification protein FlgD